MKMVRVSALAAIALGVVTARVCAETVSFAAADRVRVFAEHQASASPAKAIVLLFHQAGSNHAEYAPILPRLSMLGFDVLAVDQRSGGNLWGATNATVQHLGRSADYGEAFADLDAALAWAKAQAPGEPVIVWGSSYSAALVFLLAAKHPGEIAALLAFSPAEYLGRTGSVREAARRLTLPIFVTSAKDSEEIAAARAIADAAPAPLKVQFIPTIAGVHGSSTLRQDRNPRGAQENWAAVEAFLKGLPLGAK